MAVCAVPVLHAEKIERKKRERKSKLGCARWTAAEGILTLVVVVDGNEQVGLPSLVEEAIFRAGSHRPCHGSLRLLIPWVGPSDPHCFTYAVQLDKKERD